MNEGGGGVVTRVKDKLLESISTCPSVPLKFQEPQGIYEEGRSGLICILQKISEDAPTSRVHVAPGDVPGSDGGWLMSSTAAFGEK